MSQADVIPGRGSSWPMTVAAQGIAAAQFARCGFDVQVQPRDKSWYDLVITNAGNLLKVSVKSSEDGQWSLTQGYGARSQSPRGASFDYRAAIDRWVDSHGPRTVCCLVQFQRVAIHEMPRVYLALPQELAARMREAVERIGECAVVEQYAWTGEDGCARMEALPIDWLFSRERIEALLARPAIPNSSVAKVEQEASQIALTA